MLQEFLSICAQEKKAKAAVVLPHLHQSAATTANSSDWKDYLPVAAGGRSAAFNHGEAMDAGNHDEPTHTLGHIHYVRDSDDEQHDSDEDPDDDLDI